MPTTTLTIDGSAVTMSTNNSYPVRLEMRHGDVSTLEIHRRDGQLPGLPDPWLGKTVSLAIDGTTYFQGDVTDSHPQFSNIGWQTVYQCRCLRYRGDLVPITDDNTLTDTCAYNLSFDDVNYSAARAGRTVGEIITDVLEMDDNATNLDDLGIGNYSSLSPPTLPTNTANDLAALVHIPPYPCYIQGEKMLSAIEGFVSQVAPNIVMWIDQANGEIRFTSMDDVTDHEFELGTDRVDPTPLRRSIGDCFPRVVVRGQPQAEPVLVTLLNGGLDEDFGYGAVSSATAKAAYDPADFQEDVLAKSEGSCTCTDTLNVVVNPTDNTQAWDADAWDQTSTGLLGSIHLQYTAGTGLTQFVTRRIVSNGALTAGGTCTVTLDRALPATNYDQFKIYGLSSGQSLVYRKYLVTDADIAAAMTRQFTYPAAWVGANGDIATMTSEPMGSVCYSASGSPPYQEWPIAFTFDASTGNVIFAQDLRNLIGNLEPSDVRCLLAVNKGNLTAIAPASGYEGTSNTVEGIERTLTITAESWRDPINQDSMEDYAQDMLDSVKDTIVEGSIVVHDLYTAGLRFGGAVSVTGDSYTTGWEGLAIPIREASLQWNSGTGTHYTTTLHCSNRRAHFTSGSYLAPSRIPGSTFGDSGTFLAPGADLSALPGGPTTDTTTEGAPVV